MFGMINTSLAIINIAGSLFSLVSSSLAHQNLHHHHNQLAVHPNKDLIHSFQW